MTFQSPLYLYIIDITNLQLIIIYMNMEEKYDGREGNVEGSISTRDV